MFRNNNYDIVRGRNNEGVSKYNGLRQVMTELVIRAGKRWRLGN